MYVQASSADEPPETALKPGEMLLDGAAFKSAIVIFVVVFCSHDRLTGCKK